MTNESYVLMGIAGSGKSTLLEVLAMRQKAGVVGGDIAARAEEVGRRNHSLQKLDRQHDLYTLLLLLPLSFRETTRSSCPEA